MKAIFGMLTGFMEFLLKTAHSFVGNFGVAIILVTIFIKILLLPLTLKQDRSMKDMKKLQPKLEEIKRKYAYDKAILNQKTMELYREHRVNPAAGCLPILIQLPILWAIFSVLRGGIIPADATFLWLKLSQPDPYYILPLLNGATTYLQQKLTGGSQDNAHMKNMMAIMPIMIIFMSYKLPAGVTLYWFVSSLTGIIQQYFILKRKD